MDRTPHRPPTRRALAALALALAAAGCHWRGDAERAAAPIVERNAEARGGRARWTAVRTMAVSGQLDAGRPVDQARLAASLVRQARGGRGDGRRPAAAPRDAELTRVVALPFRMELKRPRMSRLEVRFRGEDAVQVFDGERGLKLRPFLGRREVEPFTPDELRQAARQSALDGPLLDAERRGERVELVGTEQVEGRDAYKLRLTGRDGEPHHVWVDVESGLDVRTDARRRVDGQERTVWTTYRDWRKVDGLLVPHLLETSVEGIRGTERIVVEKVALNVPLEDARFTAVN